MMYKFFLFICLLLPFQVALNPAEGIDLASIRVFILLLLFFCLAEALKNKQIKIHYNIQTGLVFSFIFLSLLSFFVADNNDWALRKLAFLFSIFPVYFVSSYLIDSNKKLILIIKSLVFGGGLVSILGIVQFILQFVLGVEQTYKFWAKNIILPFLGKSFSQAVLENPSWLVNISGETYLRATAVFPDPHMLSFFLGIIIALALSLFLSERRKIFYGLILAGLLICDLLTFSRGGYLGLVSGFIFLVIFFWERINIKIKTIFLAGCILAGFLLSIPNPISARYVSIFNLREGSNKERIEIWQKTLKIIENNPWLGVGIGNYPLQIKPTANYREPYYAHNTYLDVAVETGIANGAVWLSLLFFSGMAFFKKAKKKVLFLGPAIGVVIFSVQSLVETAIYSPVVLTLFLILLSFNNLKFHENQDS